MARFRRAPRRQARVRVPSQALRLRRGPTPPDHIVADLERALRAELGLPVDADEPPPEPAPDRPWWVALAAALLGWMFDGAEMGVFSLVGRSAVQDLLTATRSGHWFLQGLSPRAGIAIMRAAKAQAFLSHRDYVAPDDIAAILPQTAAHRLIPVSNAGRGSVEQVRAMLDAVALP